MLDEVKKVKKVPATAVFQPLPFLGEEDEEGEGGAKGDEVKNEVKKEKEPVGRVNIERKELTELQERSNELKAMLMGSSMSRAAASAEQPRLTDVKKEEEEEDCFTWSPEEMTE